MNLNLQQLDNHLQQGLKNIYLFSGDETLLLQDGQYAFLDRHLARLQTAARRFGHVADAQCIRAALAAQLHQPVQWTHTIRALAAQGVTHWLECGPGKVLTGLVKRTVEGATLVALEDPTALAAASATLKENP